MRIKLNNITEINLKDITMCERFINGQYDDPPAGYTYQVATMLDLLKIYTTKDEAIQEHKAGMWEDLLKAEPYRYAEIAGSKIVDLQTDLLITPDNPMYNMLFAYALRNCTLFRIEKFLDYHLAKYYGSDLRSFVKFLRLLIRQYATVEMVIPQAEAVTAAEWIAEREREEKEQATQVSGTTDKGEKIIRRRDDGLTKLSQEQSVLLLQYLQELGAILPDRLLTNTVAARCFSQLTGYSANTLRQDWVNYSTLETVENLEKLHTFFTRLSIHVNNKLPGKKPKP